MPINHGNQILSKGASKMHRSRSMTRMVNVMLIAGVILAGCNGCNDSMILEKKYIPALTVTEVKASPQVVLHIQGLVMHSAMGVTQVETFSDSRNYIVLVHLALARSGITGNLDIYLNLPADVDAVLFGESREVIWTRHP